MLKVSRKPDGQPEIFYSIQGEGVNIGRPAVFLRLCLCNLKCSWCDTKYTWDWSQYSLEEQCAEMPIELVNAEILKFNRPYLVVTGGEPLIQQDQLIPLLKNLKNHEFRISSKRLRPTPSDSSLHSRMATPKYESPKNQGFFIEIETNGTIAPNPNLLKLVNHWSISPKLQNSGNARSLREISECYSLFANLDSSHFKFVIRDETDLQELQTLTQTYHLNSEKIILMPEAQNLDVFLERSRWLVEICKARGFRFSIRLQTLLWGNARGK